VNFDLTHWVAVVGVVCVSRRGSCNSCGCEAYDGGGVGKKCLDCEHTPGQHKNLDLKEKVAMTVEDGGDDLFLNTDAEVKNSSPLEKRVPWAVSHKEESPVDVLDSLPGTGEVEVSESFVGSNIPVAALILSDDSRCIYPNCDSPKYKDKEKTHPFCGRYHAKMFEKLESEFQIVCLYCIIK